MEYMIVFKEPQSDFDRRHDDAYWGAWGAYVAALQQSGISKGGNGLQPPHTATQVRVRDGQR